MKSNRLHLIQGVTLVELISTVAIISILAATGLPYLQGTVQNNKMVAKNNELLAALNFTRSAAITQGTSATFCKRNTAGTDCDNSASWNAGWIVFDDKNNDYNIDSGEPIFNVYRSLTHDLQLDFGKNRVIYNNQGFSPGYNGTFLLCDSRGDSHKRGIKISATGRTRSVDHTELTSSANTCPTLEP